MINDIFFGISIGVGLMSIVMFAITVLIIVAFIKKEQEIDKIVSKLAIILSERGKK